MKNLKNLMVALALLALPASAFGQTTTTLRCEVCSHDVSVFMGEGGLVATAKPADKKVTWFSTCDGVTRTDTLTPNDDGMVSMLFSMDEGTACMATGEDMGTFQIGPVEDGGWFWITDDMNSAVGALVAKDIQKNDMVEITSAGAGVTMTAGTGAVYLKETATGRVGILPNILPEPPTVAAAKCGPREDNDGAYTWEQKKSCMLGAGRTKVRLLGPGSHGSRAIVTNGMVYRPTSGSLTVTADLWLDANGGYTTDVYNPANPASPTADEVADYTEAIRKGWDGKTTSGQRDYDKNWLDATFVVSVGGTGVVSDSTLAAAGASAAGITLTNTGSTVLTGNSFTPGTNDQRSPKSFVGQALVTIEADDTYCPAKGTQYPTTITVLANPGTNAVFPQVATGKDAGFTSSSLASFAALAQLRIACAPRSASSTHAGQELVPENLFPTDR